MYSQQVELPLFDIKPSKIHGVGVFAATNIPKGTIVFRYNEATPTIPIAINSIPRDIARVMLKWYAHTKTHINVPKFCPDTVHVVSLVNHSKRPNLYYNNGTYYTRRAIRKGTEFTLNYYENGYSG